ncbi:hypothetical protein KIPB_011086, partial [Kipferlia bialata]|eukprot:g11086.t1
MAPIPSNLHVEAYAQERLREIRFFQERIQGHGGNKRLIQLLPRHRRRRAMSHSVYRFPRVLLGRAIAENKRFMTVPPKPSRKHRRNASALMQRDTRLAETDRRMESHVWHTKRFHMAH